MKIELSHDILAKRIYNKASDEDKMRLKMQEFLQERLSYYKENGVLLGKTDLNYIAPFLDVITMTEEEEALLKKSKQRLGRKRRRLIVTVAGSIVLLLIFNGITRMSNSNTSYYLTQEQHQIALLEEEQEKKQVAEARADSLYKVLIEKDPAFTQQLINTYDTLQQVQLALENERDIAQSSTLSTLAKEAWEQDDKNYAFQLAAKSWELNHKNKQACEILYKIDGSGAYKSNVTDNPTALVKKHDAYIQNLIQHERIENGRGILEQSAMEVIFEQTNTVLQQKETGVRTSIKHIFEKAEETYHNVSGR